MKDFSGCGPVQDRVDVGGVVAEGAITELTGEFYFAGFIDQACQFVGTQQADDAGEMTRCTAAVVGDGARLEQPYSVVLENSRQ